MLKRIRVLFVSGLAIMLCASLFLSNLPIRAQGIATASLQLLQPASGEISTLQHEQSWSFSATKGQRLSVRMQATSGDLNPFVELLDKTGKVLASSSSTSLHNVTIDAFVAPETEKYTLRASFAKTGKATAGMYSIWLLPGYSFLLLNDPSGTNAPIRTWKLTNAFSRFVENKVEMQLTANNAYTFTTVADKLGVFKDLYMQADIEPQAAKSYWEAGLLLRSAKQNDVQQFYVFFVNSDNKWKLTFGQPGALKVIRDWQPLPTTTQSPVATLGMMVKGNQFTLFYNGQVIGEITDDTLGDPGSFGIAIGTGKAPNNNTNVRFSNFVVTLPADEAPASPLGIPDKLHDWQRAQEGVLAELSQLRLIPGIGKTGLEIKSKAFVTNNTAGGIAYQPLAESLNFTDLVYSADVTWEASNDNVACALELRAADDNNFTIVYFDRKGGYGVRQVSEKDGVTVSLYNLSDAIVKDNLGINRLTIIAVGNNLIAYINGILIANLTVKQTSGGVRIAAYNYQRASSICQFTNLWLRSFDQ
ncbi:MAG: hypothetical protein ABI947_07830 [Chloroflexota bacterium]